MGSIPDPSDWPPHAHALRDIELLLRCPICKEMFEAPTSLPCRHMFCSTCVRRHLQIKDECPSCNLKCKNGVVDLRACTALDAIVDVFRKGRPDLLQSVRGTQPTGPPVPALQHRSQPQPPEPAATTPKPLRRPSSINRMDADPEPDDDDFESDYAVPRAPNRALATPNEKPQPTPTPRSALKRNRTSSQSDDGCAASSISAAPAPMSHVTASSSLAEPSPEKFGRVDDIVNCPVCNKKVKNVNVSVHIDTNCTSLVHDPYGSSAANVFLSRRTPSTMNSPILRPTSSSKAGGNSGGAAAPKPVSASSFLAATTTTSTSTTSTATATAPIFPATSVVATHPPLPPLPLPPPAPPPAVAMARKPVVDYQQLKIPKMRQLLQEDGLRATGDWSAMKQRHAEFVLRFNANLDRAVPRPVEEVRRAVEKWEDERLAAAAAASGSVGAGAGTGGGGGGGAGGGGGDQHAMTEEIEQGIKRHKEQHREQFDELMRQAALTRARKRQKKDAAAAAATPGDADGGGGGGDGNSPAVAEAATMDAVRAPPPPPPPQPVLRRPPPVLPPLPLSPPRSRPPPPPPAAGGYSNAAVKSETELAGGGDVVVVSARSGGGGGGGGGGGVVRSSSSGVKMMVPFIDLTDG
ncbi:hypothetical protein DFJ73DRAFT_128881 [Zopfochytrium polystomum]|nr:hypothetical protein DFJ73DRAFT_128881 [Zopfochytrium polystomum]